MTDENKKKKKRKYLLLVSNIIPLLAVLFLNWSIFELVFVYFAETVLALLLSFVRIFYLDIPISSKIGNTFLYIFVFGIFILFAGSVSFLYYFAELEKASPDANIHDILAMIFNKSFFASLFVFFIVDIYYLITNYIRKKEYQKQTTQTLIREPGIRIWLLVMIMLLSVAIINFLNYSSVLILVIFITLKTGIDLLFQTQKASGLDVRDLYN